MNDLGMPSSAISAEPHPGTALARYWGFLNPRLGHSPSRFAAAALGGAGSLVGDTRQPDQQTLRSPGASLARHAWVCRAKRPQARLLNRGTAGGRPAALPIGGMRVSSRSSDERINLYSPRPVFPP